MHNFIKILIAAGLASLLSLPLQAQVTIPHQFAAGDKAVAAEVNANFQALVEALERIDTLEQENQSMAETLQLIAQSNVMAMDDFVEVMEDPYIAGGTTLRFSGVNLQLVNGSGATNGGINGLGNLIVGYNEERSTLFPPVCSRDFYRTQSECETFGGVWAVSHKSGSHNIVGGWGSSYSSYGGLVVGRSNTISSRGAAVTGGFGNTAGGLTSSISGGAMNIAGGEGSSVSGGRDNHADDSQSSISGGSGNSSRRRFSSILGGQNQTAWADYQTIPAID